LHITQHTTPYRAWHGNQVWWSVRRRTTLVVSLNFVLNLFTLSVLQALIEAERKGETWKQLGLLPAPHHVGADGVVQVPPKWENMVLHSEAFKQHQAAEKGQAGKPSPVKAK